MSNLTDRLQALVPPMRARTTKSGLLAHQVIEDDPLWQPILTVIELLDVIDPCPLCNSWPRHDDSCPISALERAMEEVSRPTEG